MRQPLWGYKTKARRWHLPPPKGYDFEIVELLCALSNAQFTRSRDGDRVACRSSGELGGTHLDIRCYRDSGRINIRDILDYKTSHVLVTEGCCRHRLSPTNIYGSKDIGRRGFLRLITFARDLKADLGVV